MSWRRAFLRREGPSRACAPADVSNVAPPPSERLAVTDPRILRRLWAYSAWRISMLRALQLTAGHAYHGQLAGVITATPACVWTGAGERE